MYASRRFFVQWTGGAENVTVVVWLDTATHDAHVNVEDPVMATYQNQDRRGCTYIYVFSQTSFEKRIAVTGNVMFSPTNLHIYHLLVHGEPSSNAINTTPYEIATRRDRQNLRWTWRSASVFQSSTRTKKSFKIWEGLKE